MLSFARATFTASAFVVLSACQMTTGTAPMDFEAMQAQNKARTAEVVRACRVSECGRLNLDSGMMDDYSMVADMGHVTALMASYTDFADLSDLAGMGQLRELHIGASKVTDLSGLSQFPNLRLLHAQSLDVPDYAPVGRMSRLEELVIGRSSLSDIRFVSGLGSLKTLNISGSRVTDLSPLAGLRALEVLEMEDMPLPADLSPLLRLPNLKTLAAVDWGTLTPEQQQVIDQLTARGVEFLVQPVVVVC